MDRLPDILPVYGRDIPAGSCALVVYTMSTLKTKRDKHTRLFMNLQYVVLLGMDASKELEAPEDV